MSWGDGLFELPEVPKLSKPKKLMVGTGPITYTAYRPIQPVRCDDCAQCVYEALMEHRLDGALMRNARYKRTQGGTVLRLCAEHRQLREEAERNQEKAG